MKLFTIFFSVLLFVTCPSKAQNENELINNFAIKLIEAFKTKSYNQFDKLHVNKDEFYNELVPLLQGEADSLHPQNKYNALKDSHLQELYITKKDTFNKALFQHYLEQGKNAGVNEWSVINFKKVVLLPNKIKRSDYSTTCHIIFTYNNQDYIIAYLTLMRLKSGCKIISMYGISKYVESEMQ